MERMGGLSGLLWRGSSASDSEGDRGEGGDEGNKKEGAYLFEMTLGERGDDGDDNDEDGGFPSLLSSASSTSSSKTTMTMTTTSTTTTRSTAGFTVVQSKTVLPSDIQDISAPRYFCGSYRRKAKGSPAVSPRVVLSISDIQEGRRPFLGGSIVYLDAVAVPHNAFLAARRAAKDQNASNYYARAGAPPLLRRVMESSCDHGGGRGMRRAKVRLIVEEER